MRPEIGNGTASAFGGAPHQSEKVLLGTFSDSFSPRGEALYLIGTVLLYGAAVWFFAKGFSLEGEAVKNRLFGTDF